MYRLLVLVLLLHMLSACGDTDQLYDNHRADKVVFKTLINVVSGSVVPPPGRTLVSVELIYGGDLLGSGITAFSCQPKFYAMLTGESGDPPQALFCEDNNFYFSDVMSNSFTIRAAFDNGTYLENIFSGILSNTQVTLTEYDDWNNKSGTTLSVAGSNSSNSIVIR
jgi:hypothetical protein